MAGYFGFEPSGERGRAVDAAIRAKLADSLDRVIVAISGHLAADAGGLRALAAAVRAHPVRPGVMALYADAVPALLAGDRTRAEHVLSALANPAWQDASTMRIVTLDDAGLGPGMAARYRHQLQDDPDNPASFGIIDAPTLDLGRDRVSAARALLAAASPGLDAEIGALVSEIILVDGDGEPDALVFHGASSFLLWGSLVLNLAEHPTRVKLVEGIVHEAAHSLLHGLTAGSPLVENTPAERYGSPLRDDPRPMDGLVHAAYVLARMHLAMSAVANAPQASVVERNEASERKERAGKEFASAVATITGSARFTREGAEIFAGATAYMDQATTG